MVSAPLHSFILYILLVCGALSAFASPLPLLELESRANGVDQSTYSDMERYAKYSSATYQLICPKPLGNKLVTKFDVGGTTGFVARDDGRKEIVVAFRGTADLSDIITDAGISLKSMLLTGVTCPSQVAVHSGFQVGYKNVESSVLNTVKSQLVTYPTYRVVVTGHSLGGALASLSAISLKSGIPNANLKLFTYGQPRAGNGAFASLVESLIGTPNIFRSVHTFDGVPTFFLDKLGYKHFASEFWQFQEPANAGNIKICAGGEDPKCSDSIPSTFINVAHLSYFGQVMAINPFLCF
ncbi:Alpha/Beta hydrolase protein [Crepidotus variabilis]|uniref:Alpha/Beta hydrolase protein n=1 Tax=Crepidotus variabilis TaxID=179855 RepID=A0A9P6EE95_9AGAR|nr:Alpha/Beta hydrolase protein [Crepidotus variabilis]